MQTSDKLDKLAPALALAQAAMAGAKKDSDNPFFKSKYADLTSVWKACKAPLHENGLSVVQSPIFVDGRIGVTTMLLHSSGQWIKGDFTVAVKKQNDPQADVSSVTYCRRASLAAFVGVSPEDKDGEDIVVRDKKTKPVKDHEGERLYMQFVSTLHNFANYDDCHEWLKDCKAEFEARLNPELLQNFRMDCTDHLAKLKKVAVLHLEVQDVMGEKEES